MDNQTLNIFDSPLLPWRNGRVVIRDIQEFRIVCVGGVLFHRYHIDDSAAQRFAIVSLVEAGLLRPAEIFPAFGVHERSFYRWQQLFSQFGMLGLIDRPHPGRPPRLSPDTDSLIVSLREGKATYQEIAHQLGITIPFVRGALKRKGFQQICDEQLPLPGLSQDEERLEVQGDGPFPSALEAPTFPLAFAQAPSEEPVAPPIASPIVSPDCLPSCAPAFIPSADTDPRDRSMDRFLASRGLLFGAKPLFASGISVPQAGVLLALPFINASGILAIYLTHYKEFELSAAFYGLQHMVLTLLFMALLRIKHPENLKEYNPIPLGRLLGLDRVPEMKTLRRKLTALAIYQQGALVMKQLGQRHLYEEQLTTGVLYIDGHVREYSGKGSLAHGFSTCRNKAVRSTTDTALDDAVNDARGEPAFLVTSVGHERGECGPDASARGYRLGNLPSKTMMATRRRSGCVKWSCCAKTRGI